MWGTTYITKTSKIIGRFLVGIPLVPFAKWGRVKVVISKSVTASEDDFEVLKSVSSDLLEKFEKQRENKEAKRAKREAEREKRKAERAAERKKRAEEKLRKEAEKKREAAEAAAKAAETMKEEARRETVKASGGTTGKGSSSSQKKKAGEGEPATAWCGDGEKKRLYVSSFLA